MGMSIYHKTFLFCVLALLATVTQPARTEAQEKDGVGYGGAHVQLKPLMVPIRFPGGQIRFEALIVRLTLDVGARERPACFSIPIVHEKLLLYLYGAGLTQADTIGPRRGVLTNKILEVAIASTAKGYYSAAEIVDQSTLELEMKQANVKKDSSSGASTPKEQLENKSKTLTIQCQ
jgi:hypothetical protein